MKDRIEPQCSQIGKRHGYLSGDTGAGGEQIRRLFVFAKGYGLKQCSAAAIAAYAVARQTALAISGKMHDNTDMAAWAASAAMWTVLNVTERLAPTGYGLTARV
ncbi:hypothetical protein ELH28_16375 [Rhizobium ruizarguesonis]|nr:hypothetical protein ELH28_16375 [Rhizobium ruizarguesonis]